MTQQTKDKQQKPGQTHPAAAAEAEAIKQNAEKQKQKSEQSEVAGRHKNDGQKDHKGAR